MDIAILAVTVSIVSTISAVLFAFLAFSRGKSKDDKADASKLAEIVVKLETITTGIKDIKEDIRNIRGETKKDMEGLRTEFRQITDGMVKTASDDRERIAKVESSLKSYHSRLDEFLSKKE